MSFGVIGNTPVFGAGEWRFEPSRDNIKIIINQTYPTDDKLHRRKK